MEPLLLGLSNGTLCLAYCAPVLVPFFLGEGAGTRRNVSLLLEFLLGRLTGYLMFAVVAWVLGLLLLPTLAWRQVIFGCAYLLLAALLVAYGFFNLKSRCPWERAPDRVKTLFLRWPAAVPLALGLLTGFNLCPPFLLAMTRAAATPGILHSLRFFIFFFVGTSVYFLPIPLIGVFSSMRPLQIVGRLACGIMGVYYFYLGAIVLHGGVSRV